MDNEKKVPPWIKDAVRRAEKGPQKPKIDPGKVQEAVERALKRSGESGSEGPVTLPPEKPVSLKVQAREALKVMLDDMLKRGVYSDNAIARWFASFRLRNPGKTVLRALSSTNRSPDGYEDVISNLLLDDILRLLRPFFENENLSLEELDAELTAWISRIDGAASLHVLSIPVEHAVGSDVGRKIYQLELTLSSEG